VLSSATTCLWKSFRRSRTQFRDRPETVRLHPEPVFTFIPESCSGSSRNTVRNHPGIAFTLPRIPHYGQFPKLDVAGSPGGMLFRMSESAAVVKSFFVHPCDKLGHIGDAFSVEPRVRRVSRDK
jgi:hypothetical protein